MSLPHIDVMQKHTCEPANGIIEKFGGVSVVARLLEKDESTIRRWRMPKPSGTGGTIPDDDKVRLLEAAKAEGVRLHWRDFMPVEARRYA